MNKPNLALNLSKTSIQLLKKNGKKSWNVLGSVDPSSKNLEKNLAQLREQATAISTKKPIVDVLLPRELVLSQTVVIQDNFSVEHCKKITAKRCGLNESEILIAIGESTTKSTVPIAAISANSITESRNFVRRAGFRPERYIASSKISGFKKSPVFFNDNSSRRLVDIESTTVSKVLSISSILLFTGFLLSLTNAYLEYQSNNRPYSYLVSAKKFDKFEQINKNVELNLVTATKKISIDPLDNSILEQKTLNIFIEPKILNNVDAITSTNLFSIKSQIYANQDITKLKIFDFVEKIKPISIKQIKDKPNYLAPTSIAMKEDLLTSFTRDQKITISSLPNLEGVFKPPFETNPATITGSSKKSQSVLAAKKNQTYFMTPNTEKVINHKYEKILIEEVFSDISLTKILIKTVNKRASTLPLIYFDVTKPDIFTPKNLMISPLTEDAVLDIINPEKLKIIAVSTTGLHEATETPIILNKQFNSKLQQQGLEISLLKNYIPKEFEEWNIWNGRRPTQKPKVIDTIRTLEDPTKSTGAVTFVELPPVMPLNVRNMKKVSANSIKYLNVRNNPPSIPRRASIVGNSTLKNLIELNRTNLIGIFGKRTGRIALIRLSSGNTIKVRVGQQFGDGWRVISIDLDKIHITNGNRQETLRIPG